MSDTSTSGALACNVIHASAAELAETTSAPACVSTCDSNSRDSCSIVHDQHAAATEVGVKSACAARMLVDSSRWWPRASWVCEVAAGSSTRNVVPWLRPGLSTSTVPPCSSTRLRAIASPSRDRHVPASCRCRPAGNDRRHMAGTPARCQSRCRPPRAERTPRVCRVSHKPVRRRP